MQGLADGYFVIPQTVSNYLATDRHEINDVSPEDTAFESAEQDVRDNIQKLVDASDKNREKPSDQQRTVMDIYYELGRDIMWDKVGIARNESDLETAIEDVRRLRDEFWDSVVLPTDTDTFNKNLEVAGRLSDFLELGEIMARDALERDESAGCHFREEHQSEGGEARRNDEEYAYVAAWEWNGLDEGWDLHKEDLEFENVELKTRSYK
jgi:succinate dehydrogenase / fumarate reductase flavoprotein subunit